MNILSKPLIGSILGIIYKKMQQIIKDPEEIVPEIPKSCIVQIIFDLFPICITSVITCKD